MEGYGRGGVREELSSASVTVPLWRGKRKVKVRHSTVCLSVYRLFMKKRPRSMDTARPVHNTIQLSARQIHGNIIYREKVGRGGGERECATLTCGAEYDLDRGRNAERKYDIVQQRAGCKRGDLEQILRDGDLAWFESWQPEPGAARDARFIPGYEGR
jgi:hypothetical protein